MKKIFFVALMLYTYYTNAQDAAAIAKLETYTHNKDKLFEHLDKTKLPHANLYDRVYPFANLAELYITKNNSINNDYQIVVFHLYFFKNPQKKASNSDAFFYFNLLYYFAANSFTFSYNSCSPPSS
jgi:hypothetical protein